ncbi:hypothetical protein HGRIS_012321 [Hohenbuehelia grisea]|uniref:BPL/LPL catalytic domain-containing protein n=1 Tax=Hohenbuehelia grisea TaxID=104357 RepID=A0ABR3IRX8_9AGAR
MNVLVYSGPETVQASLNATLSTLRSILLPNYSVQTVTQQAISTQPWSASCALLVFPECRKPFQSKSSSAVQAFVENGGSFLGLSTGAVFSSHGLEPEITNLTIGTGSSDPLLRFRQLMGGGYLYPTYSSTNDGHKPKASAIKTIEGVIFSVFDTGLRSFIGLKRLSVGFKPLAKYIPESLAEHDAAILYELGRGKVVLCAPSLEFSLAEEPAKSSLPASTSTLAVDRTSDEEGRLKFLRDTLSHLGLHISPSTTTLNAHPLPQFLLGNPSRSDVVPRVLESLGVDPAQIIQYQDANDTFQFHPLSSGSDIIKHARTSFDAAAQLKHIIACPATELPAKADIPIFDLPLFFATLSSIRGREGIPQDAEPWNLGDALFYGEVVTSTQTMLDKNPRLLTSLPVPFLSVASYQLAGRGRGANVWLSPAGCLQFSILIRASLAEIPANTLVFVQYLFALAVAEACRTDEVLGPTGQRVRLKWPNDLYAVVGDGPNAVKKIGGILVNTSFSSGKVDIVIGCGINVLNEEPIMSLSQLLSPESKHRLSMEMTLAAILAKFESMWSAFLAARGSFDSFMSLYLERWLHSDQVVTVMTTNPHQRVRIVGITSNHGLLRTIPEGSSFHSFGRTEYVDLQPDGNSFDLMAGMIRSKS